MLKTIIIKDWTPQDDPHYSYWSGNELGCIRRYINKNYREYCIHENDIFYYKIFKNSTHVTINLEG